MCYQSLMRAVLNCDCLALTACYCFNSVNHLLEFIFQSAVEATVTMDNILWNCRTFFSGTTNCS